MRECMNCGQPGETLNGNCPDCSKMTESKAYNLAVGFEDDDLTSQLDRILFVHTVE